MKKNTNLKKKKKKKTIKNWKKIILSQENNTKLKNIILSGKINDNAKLKKYY